MTSTTQEKPAYVSASGSSKQTVIRVPTPDEAHEHRTMDFNQTGADVAHTFTIFDAASAKHVGLVEGARKTKPADTFFEAPYRTARVANIDELHATISALKPGAVVVAGANARPEGVARRQNAAFPFADGPGLLIIDADKLADGASIDSVRASIGLADVECVASPSASSGLSGGTEPPSGLRGLHLFYLIQNGVDVPETLHRLHARSINAGHGWSRLHRTGKVSARSPVDLALKTSNQACYEGGAICHDGVTQTRTVEVRHGRAFTMPPELTEVELATFNAKVAELEAVEVAEAQNVADVRSAYLDRMAATRNLTPGQAAAALSAAIPGAGGRGTLYGDHPIKLDNGRALTVSEAIAERLHEVSCYDPLEPEEGRGRAKLYAGQDKPTINSMLHGAQVFFMKPERVNDMFDDLGAPVEQEPAAEPTLAPGVDWEAVRAGTDQVFIIECEALAAKACAMGVPAIGFDRLGAAMKRGVAHKKLTTMSWAMRRVVILPGKITTSSTRQAAGLAAWLKSRKASVTIADLAAYGVGRDVTPATMVRITQDAVGHVDLDGLMGIGWEKFAATLGEIAYLRGSGDYVHLTDFTKGASPIRTKATMESDLANRWIAEGPTRKKVFKMVTESNYRIDLAGPTFAPWHPPTEITPDGEHFNIWRGFRLSPKHDAAIEDRIRAAVRSFFSSYDPITQTVTQSDEQVMVERWYWGWMGHVTKCTPVRPSASPTMQSSAEGIGKSLIFEMAKSFMGDACKIIDPGELKGEFTNWIEGAYFVIVNELSDSDTDLKQRMKTLRTNPDVTINNKYGAKYTVPNVMAFAMTTNEAFTHGMDADARREMVYSPTWMSAAASRALPPGPHRDAEMAHQALIGELAAHLSPSTPTASLADREAWGSALYAMLLDVDAGAMGFDPIAPAPSTAAKRAMALAGTSYATNERSVLVDDFAARLSQHGGLLFTTHGFAMYLELLEVEMKPLAAKKVLASFAKGKGMWVGSDSVRVPGLWPDNATRRLWGVLPRPLADASADARLKWLQSGGMGIDDPQNFGNLGAPASMEALW